MSLVEKGVSEPLSRSFCVRKNTFGGVFAMAKVKLTCIKCGGLVERYPSQCLKTTYCSRKCRSDYMRENNTVTFNCFHCNKEKTRIITIPKKSFVLIVERKHLKFNTWLIGV